MNKKLLNLVILSIIFLLAIEFFLYPQEIKAKNKIHSHLLDSIKFDSSTNQTLEILISKYGKLAKSLPINDLMVKIALEFVGTPYVSNTLEGEPERCSVNLKGMDCVTFFENSLNIARFLKNGENKTELLGKYTLQTRYRNGIITDYSSRLHYTADWIFQNVQNKIIKDVSKDLKGQPIKFNVNFMSKNPIYYSALKSHPQLISKIKSFEDTINTRTYYYVPSVKIKNIENKLKNGDIIAIVTSKQGLDYSHTGMIYVDVKGNRRFLHASSSQKKIVIDTTISEYIKKVKSDIGITVLRPLNSNLEK